MRHRCLLLLALLSAACTTISNVPVKHIVMFDGTGTLVDPSHNTAGGKHSYVRPYPQFSPAQADAYRKAVIDEAIATAPVGSDGKRRLLLFIHGGLNFQVSTVKRATDIYGQIAKQNPLPAYPIFINWQSSFFVTYWDHIAHIRQGQYWTGPLTYALIPLWFFSDVVRAVGHAPIDYFYEIKSIADGIKDDPFYDTVRDNSDPVNGRPRMRPAYDLRSPSRKVVGASLEVVTLPLKFITAPLIDGFGTGAWDAMDHRTHALFQSDAEFNEALPVLRPAQGGLSLFLRDLAQRLKQDGRPWSVTLVGHSMGVIVVNEIVARDPGLPIDQIVYLAAACSIDDYRTTIVPYLEKNTNTTMRHVILERHAEAREWNIYDIVPRGTLLLWIDNLLSKPRSVLERRVGRYTNLMRDIHSTPPSIADRVSVLTFDGGPQLADKQPQAHTDAGSVQFWRDDCIIPQRDYPNDCLRR